ncbi:hypothetical protein [Streptomyces sp. NPDC088261]|uniref:caspase, EACC1-associated type n=1 Tax=Streptomyces sp. NPDC088261 TaxID=3365851 RepID=UPI00380D93E4
MIEPAGSRHGGDLAKPGAHAILLGTGSHISDSSLPALPSVDTTLDDLQHALGEACGMPDDRVHRVPAHASSSAIVAAVEQVVAEATGPVLLHYAGHGLLGPGDELYLATYASRSTHQIADAIAYHILKGLLSAATGGSAVILDCCFSGRASLPGGGRGVNPFTAARPRGSFLLSSASYYDLSYAPMGERHTRFTGHLLGLLENGEPSGPPLLTLDHVHAALDRRMQDEPARPHRESEGTLGNLVLAPNRAYRADPGPQDAPPADVPCPYPGMEPFRPEDSGYFHGRAALTEDLLTAARASDPEPLVLVGASGVGKSSLLRAGLIARLEAGGEPWPVLLLSAPGPSPLRQLTELWAGYTGRPPDEVRSILDEGGLPAPLPGRRSCRLLVVDQFEEVFTRCQDQQERTRFISVLTEPRPQGPRVVLSLRADHYGSCLEHPGLVAALARTQLAVPPMSTDELRAAVEHPAQAAGLTLQTGLTDRLLHDLRQGGRAGLPFLAHALRETWRRRSGAMLTLTGYQATGGIWQAVTTTTEDLYQALDEAGQVALRALLLRMVHVAADGSGDSVRLSIATSTLLLGHQDEDLLDRLVATRLVTIDHKSAQVAHEALLHAWPRLRRWIDEDRSELILRQQIADDADAWAAAGYDQAFLYRGTRLRSALELLERHPLSRDLDAEFLAKSVTAEGAEHARDAQRLRRLKVALGGIALALCLAVTAAVVAVEQRGTADSQRRLATYRALRAEAENLGTTDPRTSLSLGIAAYRLQPSADARSELFDTLVQTPFAGRTSLGFADPVELSPDGKTLAAGHGQGGVQLLDVRVPGKPKRLADLDACQEEASAVAFSPGLRALAVICENGLIGLWKLRGTTSPERSASLHVTTLPGKAEAIRFSPDGRTLGAVGWGETKEDHGAVVLWDVQNVSQPRRLGIQPGTYDKQKIEFSADGKTLATGGGALISSGDYPDKDSIIDTGGVTLWDITDPARLRKLTRFEGNDETFAFSPDGRALVLTDYVSIELWDVATPAKPRRVNSWNGQKAFVTDLAFRADGDVLATGNSDDTVNVWNVSDPANPLKAGTLSHHNDDVESLAFSTDGRQLVSAAHDEVVHWQATDRGPRVVSALGQEGNVSAIAISPDGRLLAAGGGWEVVELWDLGDPLKPKHIATLRGHTKWVRSLSFAPDGKALATGDDGGDLLFWDLTDPARPRMAATVNRPQPIISLAFLSGPRTLLVTDDTDSNTVWSAEDLARPRQRKDISNAGLTVPSLMSPDGNLFALRTKTGTALWNGKAATKPVDLPWSDSSAAFAPDSRMLATGSHNETLLLWDIRDPGHPQEIARSTEKDVGLLVEFHPRGNLLAGIVDGDIVLWSLGERGQPHRAARLTQLARGARIAGFTPDGHLLGSDGTNVLLWDLNDLPEISADTIGRACALADGGLTEEEWEEYVPGLPFQQTCPR